MIPCFAILVAALPLVFAQNSTAHNDTALLYMQWTLDEVQDLYAASIVKACTDATVYAMQCAGTPREEEEMGCGPTAPIWLLTEGPSTFILTQSETWTLSGATSTTSLEERCALQGTDNADLVATCTYMYTTKLPHGYQTQETYSTVMSGADGHIRYEIPITGGAEKTASPTGACVTPESSAITGGAEETVNSTVSPTVSSTGASSSIPSKNGAFSAAGGHEWIPLAAISTFGTMGVLLWI